MPDALSGASRLFPIIGDPIRYVESPRRLSTTFAARDVDAVCIPLLVPADDLEVVMAGLAAARNVDGLLITMPHKFTASGYCATRSERSERLGVVSVMRRNDDGTWHGDMLDGLAFVKAQRDRGAQLQGAKTLLLGAGGAGSAIAIALLQAGISELGVHDPDDARLSALIELVSDVGQGRVRAAPPDPTGFDVVCNATPLGMAEGDPLPVDPALLDKAMFVGDVIAGHGLTPFPTAAQAAGCQTADGFDMVAAAQDVMADFMQYLPPTAD